MNDETCPACGEALRDLAEVLGDDHFKKFRCPDCGAELSVEFWVTYHVQKVLPDTGTGELL